MEYAQPPLSSTKRAADAVVRWQWLLAVASIAAIVMHLVLLWNNAATVFSDMPLLVIIAVGGIPLLGQILRRLAHGNLGADLLAAIALVTAVWLKEYLAASLIVLMLSGGQALEVYAMRKASSVLLALANRLPSSVHRRQGKYIEDIPLGDIRLGDAIVIYPHEAAPIDGEIIEGHGSMDESYLTGEPYRVSKAPGAFVLSGAINGETVLVVRTEKLPADSRYARIMEVMQDAQQKRPDMRRLGDQIGAAFAPVALAFAFGTWYVTSDTLRFLSVLVIATPCPMLIAIPITIISAISMAARRGIIVKDPTVLERLPTCRTAIFDKTGTLTCGQPELTEILPAEGMEAEDILQYAASLEHYSKHPLAGAVLKAAKRAKLSLPEAQSVSEKPGQGLTGNIAGHEITVTHRNKLMQSRPQIATQLPPVAAGLECVVLLDNAYAATFRFRDTPRADGRSFIAHLGSSHQFNRIMLVSGDRESEVAYLAGIVGIDNIRASQSPEQKLAIVREEAAKAPTLYMGDGINDAPALTAATVGIAFGEPSNVTAEAAGAVIMESTLAKVDELIHISESMRRIALQSAVGGMILSIAGMGFASAGMITPVAGALLQEGIDVLAILNALRLTWGGKVEIDLNGKK